MSYNGWMISDTERTRILQRFAPRFAVVKATHVTLSLDEDAIPQDAQIIIVGYACDDEGVEALVCTVDGEFRRPDAMVFHITLSVAEGRASKESNMVISQHGWCEIEPMPIATRGFLNRGDVYITTPLSA